MNSPVKSAQLFHSLPRFPASTWQRKAKLVSVFNCVTLWECLTAYVKQNTWMEFNQIDHSPGTFVFFPLFHSHVGFHQIGCLLRKGGQTTTRRNSSRWSGASWAIFWGSRFRGTDSDHIPWRKRQDSRDFQQRSGHRFVSTQTFASRFMEINCLTAYLSRRIQTHQGKRFLFLRAGITRKLQLFWSRRWSMTCERSHLAGLPPQCFDDSLEDVRKYILN